MAVRLRYLAHDLEVPPGQFVIGRNPDCQLSLDDPHVSRRHALLTVRAGTVMIEDLGSRNGVIVNGSKIEGPHELFEGDRVTIGSQEMTLHGSGESVPARASATMAPSSPTQSMMRAVVVPPTPQAAVTFDPEATRIGSAPQFDALPQPDKRIHALSLIGSVAEKAFAMGRLDEAERLLQRPLIDLLDKAKKRDELRPEVSQLAGLYAARLAQATSKGNWVAYIFELYTLLDTVMPATLVDELYTVVRKVRTLDMNVVRTYLSTLRKRSNSLTPAERFVQQRIEGLERLGALK